jgi:hypothetical protein
MAIFTLALFVTMLSSPAWPAVRPFHEERIISLEEPPPDVRLVFTIRTDGDVQYRVECHTGDYEDMTLINFSGDYQCAMFAMKGRERTSWNLFADDSPVQTSADWFNRGRMTEGQLRGTCGASDWGVVRRFRMRGMAATLRFEDLKWGARQKLPGDHLTRFRLIIDIQPDPSATSPTTERLNTSEPPVGCWIP